MDGIDNVYGKLLFFVNWMKQQKKISARECGQLKGKFDRT
jgi:hypothetical protein